MSIKAVGCHSLVAIMLGVMLTGCELPGRGNEPTKEGTASAPPTIFLESNKSDTVFSVGGKAIGTGRRSKYLFVGRVEGEALDPPVILEAAPRSCDRPKKETLTKIPNDRRVFRFTFMRAECLGPPGDMLREPGGVSTQMRNPVPGS